MSEATYRALDPVQFVQPTNRLLIDTNVFMETRPAYAGGLKPLFERCSQAIRRYSNPIVVPSKVQDELRRSAVGLLDKDPERAAKAANALLFLDSASAMGLVRRDLGDGSNPYADDLFVALFQKFAPTYDLCLLTFDVTLKLRIRLLANRTGRRLVAGYPNRSGDISVESEAELYRKGMVKLTERRGGPREMQVLEPVLADFRRAFGLEEVRRPAPSATVRARPFSATARTKGQDTVIPVRSLPGERSRVTWESADGKGTLLLGELLSAGGEGSVYEADATTVVKIFDKEHVTAHRREKVELLVRRRVQAQGICAPTAVVRNEYGQFVGYVMAKAKGHELQRTIFNPRKLRRVFPDWKKADLVDVGISFLEKVRYLHSLNILLGDISPKNVMVDAQKNVSIIDADSWQLEGYPCPVGTPMFTSPAMLGTSYADRLRTMDDELFAVATMLFMILITGQFPYIRKGSDGDMVELIKEGYFAFQYENRNNKDQPDGDWRFKWSHVHKPVKDLIFNTFDKADGRRYRNRPTAEEWLKAFKDYRQFLRSPMNFDPMSNDIYPIRNKAYRTDTPIKDCPRCGTEAAIAGYLPEGAPAYVVPELCNKCRDPRAPASCRDCGESFAKSALVYGRCPACTKRANSLDTERLCTDCQQPFITRDHAGWFSSRQLDVPQSHAGVKKTCPPTAAPTTTTTTAVKAAPVTAARPPLSPAQVTPAAPEPAGLLAGFKKWFQG